MNEILLIIIVCLLIFNMLVMVLIGHFINSKTQQLEIEMQYVKNFIQFKQEEFIKDQKKVLVILQEEQSQMLQFIYDKLPDKNSEVGERIDNLNKGLGQIFSSIENGNEKIAEVFKKIESGKK